MRPPLSKLMLYAFLLSYTVVHISFEYHFWTNKPIFSKYANSLTSEEAVEVSSRVYYTKATWMYACVVLQGGLGVGFPRAIAWSFALYAAELIFFFGVSRLTVSNAALAIGLVLTQ